MENNVIMSPGEVCAVLNIKESTLRKYALILQKAGYSFVKNGKGQRAYYSHDVAAIKKLIDIKLANSDMSLEDAANVVMTWVDTSNVALRDTPKEEPDRYKDDIEELKTIVTQQNLLLAELVKKIDQQQKYIDEKLEQRDNRLMESIRESQEVKQQLLQIAASQEEEKEKKSKKGFFGWFK